MERLFDSRVALEDSELAIRACTEKYTQILNLKFDRKLLKLSSNIYTYRKIRTNHIYYKFSPDSMLREKMTGLKHLSDLLLCNHTENEQIIIDAAENKASPVLSVIEEYRHAISQTYQKFNRELRHVSPTKGLRAINSSKARLNNFVNEIVDAVFAASSYKSIVLYIGRAVAGWMHVMDKGNVCIYPKNPYNFRNEQQNNDWVQLLHEVCVYTMKADAFEAVIDFREEENKYGLHFAHEWISRNNIVACECEYIKQIPKKFLLECKIFFCTKDIQWEEYYGILRKKENKPDWVILNKAQHDRILVRVDLEKLGAL
jgi:hypothetical protein